jgi:hypothetical protein
MHPGAPFVQFTYAVVPPIPAKCEAGSYTASRSNRGGAEAAEPVAQSLADPVGVAADHGHAGEAAAQQRAPWPPMPTRMSAAP